ncbi:MAG: hypothetical protein ACP6IQ_02090 [Candidatus Njordarchaeia archaeon]
MAVISETLFEGITDRAAFQFQSIKANLAALGVEGTGTQYHRVTSTNDSDIEVPLVESADTSDKAFSASDAAVKLCRNFTDFTQIITGLEEHFRRVNLDNPTIDGYCEASGVLVSNYFNQIYYARRGRYLLARHVFCEEEKTFCSCTVTPSGINFVDRDDFGDGSPENYADGNNFAGEKVKAVVTSPTISVPINIRIIGLNENGEDQTIESGAIIIGNQGDEINIPSASGRFVDITNVELVSGGSNGDSFDLKPIKERIVKL